MPCEITLGNRAWGCGRVCALFMTPTKECHSELIHFKLGLVTKCNERICQYVKSSLGQLHWAFF